MITNVDKNKLAQRANSDPSRSVNTLVYLKNIYDSMLSSMPTKSRKQASSKDTNAQILENFLNGIKYIQMHNDDNGNPTIDGYQSILKEVEQESFNQLLKNMVEINPSLAKYKYFTWSADRDNGIGIQKGIDRARDALLKTIHTATMIDQYNITSSKGLKATKQDYKTSNSLLQMSMTIPNLDFSNIADNIARDLIQNQIYEKMGLSKPIENTKTQNGITTHSSAFGAITNVGLSAEVQYTSNSTVLNQILDALTEATFATTYKAITPKMNFQINGINPYLVFMNTAPGNSMIRSGRYYRMLNCFDRHDGGDPDHSEAPSYFYRIQQIYALTRWNNNQIIRDQILQQVLGNQMFSAKYLVVNDPNADQIKVYSTTDIVNDYLSDLNIMGKLKKSQRVDKDQALSGNIKIEF